MELVEGALVGFLRVFTAVFPDTGMLDASRPLLEGTPIPLNMLSSSALQAAVPVLLFLAFGWFILRRRDLC